MLLVRISRRRQSFHIIQHLEGAFAFLYRRVRREARSPVRLPPDGDDAVGEFVRHLRRRRTIIDPVCAGAERENAFVNWHQRGQTRTDNRDV